MGHGLKTNTARFVGSSRTGRGALRGHLDLIICLAIRSRAMLDVQLARADAVSWLRGLPAASVDLVITDPPYESLEKHRAIGTTTRLKVSKASNNPWFEIFPNARFPELFAEIYRVLKPNSHFYLFSDPETAFVAKPLAEAAGFKFWKPLVWDKKSIGMGYHYRARYEFVLFFEKGKRRLEISRGPTSSRSPGSEAATPRRSRSSWPRFSFVKARRPARWSSIRSWARGASASPPSARAAASGGTTSRTRRSPTRAAGSRPDPRSRRLRRSWGRPRRRRPDYFFAADSASASGRPK